MRLSSLLLSLILLAAAGASAQVGNNQGLANANLVPRETLLTLPHIDATLADAIIDGRPYKTALELNRQLASRLSEDQRAELYGRLFRPLNLNTASREEILLIPGMNGRMVHEFEEYRPYTSLTQFRREIGKYVDNEEVARLERYVFIPLNLNRASAEDFMTIPGMSRRMVHEFEEYRPYESMEQFRREIGKYVDENEVARLESYLTLE